MNNNINNNINNSAENVTGNGNKNNSNLSNKTICINSKRRTPNISISGSRTNQIDTSNIVQHSNKPQTPTKRTNNPSETPNKPLIIPDALNSSVSSRSNPFPTFSISNTRAPNYWNANHPSRSTRLKNNVNVTPSLTSKRLTRSTVTPFTNSSASSTVRITPLADLESMGYSNSHNSLILNYQTNLLRSPNSNRNNVMQSNRAVINQRSTKTLPGFGRTNESGVVNSGNRGRHQRVINSNQNRLFVRDNTSSIENISESYLPTSPSYSPDSPSYSPVSPSHDRRSNWTGIVCFFIEFYSVSLFFFFWKFG